ncbi:MAG: DUF2203 domain-containing protein [Actinomycetota bacterium]|nr:DUF2203 domain-containing protein [Actinomycetota bacterium]
MERTFTLEEARTLLPEARARIRTVAALTSEARQLERALRDNRPAAGGVPELKALDARVHDELSWFAEHGVQVKGIAPALLDFPARAVQGVVLLCWLEGEDDLAWYHPVETGFLGRAPIAELRLL